MLKLARSPVVVAFDKVDGPASQPLSIGGHTFRSSQAEVPEEIENIVRFGASVDTLADRFVHLLRVRKRTIAVPNDVEVAEMKIGGEPDTAHTLILVDLGACRRHLSKTFSSQLVTQAAYDHASNRASVQSAYRVARQVKAAGRGG